MRISLLGAGNWGTAIARLLGSKGFDITWWVRRREVKESIDLDRKNPGYLPFVEIPESVHPTNDIQEALADSEFLFIAIPAKFLESLVPKWNRFIPKSAKIVSLVKGMVGEDAKTPLQYLREAMPERGEESFSVLSGPNLAEEVARGFPTASVSASKSPDLARTVQTLFSDTIIRVYTSSDPLGVELGGVVKNVIAIACGLSDGIGFGENTRALLIARGLLELVRYGVFRGAHRETLYGLSGLGDLIATATSKKSRNYQVGERLTQGESLQAIIKSSHQVAEGVESARLINATAEKAGLDLPITKEVYLVLFEGKNVKEAIRDLLARELKEEFPESGPPGGDSR